MKLLLKLTLLAVVVGGGFALYTFWDDLTPGERYHMVDKARRGDIEGFIDTAKFKANEHLETQKQKAAEALKELSDKAVDAAAQETKGLVHSKIDEELGGKKGAKADAPPGASEAKAP